MDIKDAVLSLVKDFELEDNNQRLMNIPRWTRNEYYWRGIQNLFWSTTESTWKIPSMYDIQNLDDDDIDEILYNKVVNIYRAHGESVCAALSIDLPTVKFFPEDADNYSDIVTAKAASKVAELIDIYNKSMLLFMRALYILFNQDFVAAYVYGKESDEFGMYKEPVYDKKMEPFSEMQCMDCGATVQAVNDACPECGSTNPPTTLEGNNEVVYQSGYVDKPKSRSVIDVFGPLNVKIPYKCRTQKDIAYLILELDQHPSIVIDTYGDADIVPRETEDSLARNAGELYQNNLVTVKRCWIRPWAYNKLGKNEVETIKELKKTYPNGIYAVIVNDKVLDMRDEKLDSRWVICQDPLSAYLHSDPLGQGLIPMQDIKNDLVNHTLQAIEYGIPETFADPKFLQFDLYRQQRVRHGMIYPAKKPAGGSMQENFHTLKTATLSQEVNEFEKTLEQDAQFVSGDFPSIYGGPAQGGSKTLGEYNMSRNQALQRLSNKWKMLKFWWADVVKIATELMISIIATSGDEKFVKEQGESFVNIWIKTSELEGKIGRVEPESSEAFPSSFAQKRDVLMQLITAANPNIDAALYNSENASLLAECLGLSEFYIPGDVQRTKQIFEVGELLKSGPIMEGEPSVPIDPDVDDDQVHIDTLRNYLASPKGIEEKKINPMGYINCVAHLKMHDMNLAMKTMMVSQGTPPGEAPSTASSTVEG